VQSTLTCELKPLRVINPERFTEYRGLTEKALIRHAETRLGISSDELVIRDLLPEDFNLRQWQLTDIPLIRPGWVKLIDYRLPIHTFIAFTGLIMNPTLGKVHQVKFYVGQRVTTRAVFNVEEYFVPSVVKTIDDETIKKYYPQGVLSTPLIYEADMLVYVEVEVDNGEQPAEVIPIGYIVEPNGVTIA
jgi:hypothetical protein